VRCKRRLETRGGRQCFRAAVWGSGSCTQHLETVAHETLTDLAHQVTANLSGHVSLTFVTPTTPQAQAHTLRAVAKVFGRES
jgi:hypothetical protein